MVEDDASPDVPRGADDREQLRVLRMAEADSDVVLRGQLHDADDLWSYRAVRLVHQAEAVVLRLSRPAPEAVRRKRGKPDHLEVRILQSDANGFGVHSVAGPRPRLSAPPPCLVHPART